MRVVLGSEEELREEFRESIIEMLGVGSSEDECGLVSRNMVLEISYSKICYRNCTPSSVANSMLPGRSWRRASDKPCPEI